MARNAPKTSSTESQYQNCAAPFFPIYGRFIKALLPVITVLLLSVLLSVSESKANDYPLVKRELNMAVRVAKGEADSRVFEKTTNATQDNLPRYLSTGRLAPYALVSRDANGTLIGNPWCVSFAAFVWGTVAEYMGGGPMTVLQRPHKAFKARMWTQQYPTGVRHLVPVRVREVWNWARMTGRARALAVPGYIVIYSEDHLGIVTEVDKYGAATKAIDGNTPKGSVEAHPVNHREILGYVSPYIRW